MASYSKGYILEKLSEALENPVGLYKKPFINYRGKTTDTKEKYTEVLAAAIIDNVGALKSIPTVTRTSGYKVKTHDGTTALTSSNREEERIALSMFGKEYAGIGKILDYQVPLKDTSEDKGLGKIDLLAYDGQVLRLLELKKPKSDETLLRCVLEVYTYRCIVDDAVLLSSFELPRGTTISQAALIYSDCEAFADYHEDNTCVKRLMELLGVELFVLPKYACQALEELPAPQK